LVSMNPFDRFGLTENPFGIVPVKGLKVWADRKKFLSEVEEVIRSALSSTPSRLVACFHGDWGAGKTHSAVYFSNREVLRRYAAELGEKDPLSTVIILPVRDVFDTLYLDILEEIGFDAIRKAVDSLRKGSEPLSAEFIAKLRRIVEDEKLAKVLAMSPDDIEKYVVMSAATADLRRMRVTRGVRTSSDKLRVLRGVLNLLTNTLHSRIILWIDDCERLGELTGRDQLDFQVFVRDLLDYVPLCLNIILNFTLPPGQKVEDIEVYLGDALRSRLHRRIVVGPLAANEFIEYVRDLLESKRPVGFENPNPYFPFKSEKVLLRVSRLMRQRRLSLTPRAVNSLLSSFLEEASRDEKRTVIDTKFVDTAMRKIM